MDEAIATSLDRFTSKHAGSGKLFESALRSLPGGNTRSLLYTAPFPISMHKGDGYRLWDVDGNEYEPAIFITAASSILANRLSRYIDLVSELTAGLFGHSDPRLQTALTEAIHDIGIHLGATNPLEQRYASLICKRFGLDRVRFCNSGTEANLHCLAAARAFTKRRKIIAFRGGYHGSVLGFSNGPYPNNVDQQDFILLQYNDVDGLEQAFSQHQDVAAVIVEAMQGSAGFIPASPEFLEAIRKLSEKV